MAAAKEASDEALIEWDEVMIEDPAVQPDAPPAGAATSSAGGRPEVEAATAAIGQACLCELVYWLGVVVGLLVGVVWLV